MAIRPTYWLASHAMELTLKAFLLVKGQSEHELEKRVDVRHSIEHLVTMALKSGLSMPADVVGVFNGISKAHKSFYFRYGAKDDLFITVPVLIDVLAAAPNGLRLSGDAGTGGGTLLAPRSGATISISGLTRVPAAGIRGSSSSGDAVSVTGFGGVNVFEGYVSDTPFSSTMTWDGTTLAAMGLAVGDTATWKWSGGTFSIDVVPLPATLPLFATGLGALGLLGWRRKRRARGIA